MYKKIVTPIVLLLFILQSNYLLFANEKAKTEESTKAVAEVKTEKKTEGDVVAIVNGEKVFRRDFDRRLSVLKRMNQEVTRSTQMLVVNQLTKKVLLKQFVEGQNIDVSNEEVQGEVEKIKFFLKSSPNNSEKPLEEILESQGSSISELEAEVKRTLALSKYLDKEVSDDEKRSYFDANKSAFNGERVRASHILIDTRKMKTDAELEDAKQKIGDIKKEIDNGADFAEMAKKYSDCPSAEKGGDIDFFQRKGSVVEEFAKVAFSMEVGEVSEPVKTPFGYHIIKVTDREEGKDVSYEDVSDMVDFVYMQIKTETLLEGLIEKAEIKVFL
ncbi:MAG: peptidylprolyl isomerase [Candidatus Scalinduaceae bacterium]